mgnify:FL=1
MTLNPQHRYIHPGDQEKEISVTFTLAELKQIQNKLLENTEQVAAQENAAYQPDIDLAQKLEYHITELTKD